MLQDNEFEIDVLLYKRLFFELEMKHELKSWSHIFLMEFTRLEDLHISSFEEHETSLVRFLFNSVEMDESFGHMHHLHSEFVTIPETAYVLDTHGQFGFWIADIVLWKWEGAKTLVMFGGN